MTIENIYNKYKTIRAEATSEFTLWELSHPEKTQTDEEALIGEAFTNELFLLDELIGDLEDNINES